MKETRHHAERLLGAMERRFRADSGFEKLYRNFMSEYEELGHMALAPHAPEARTCYLPHHGVFKAADGNRTIRVVFNGSQKIHGGESLNQFLLPGPTLLPHLADVVSRWRFHAFAFSADVEKMYRQIRVHSEDQDLQRILWRDDATKATKEYRLKTVTYGLSCAPFLAIRTLHQLAEDEATKFPAAAAVLKRDVYVDDIFSGSSTLQGALDLQRDLVDLCKAGGFPLRKWAANDPRLLVNTARDDVAISISMDKVHSALGLQWHPQEDCFAFSTTVQPRIEKTTKRVVLSCLAQLFDPLGWLSPVTVTIKILMQSLWLQRIDWDTPLTQRDEELWRVYWTRLSHLENLRIPRFLGVVDDLCELHGFADASERALAAVLYLRCRNQDGLVTSTLLTAKAKVAPIKPVSLPRLELTAAALLVKLATRAVELLPLQHAAIHLWSDLTVTLGWIAGHPSRWTTFVANRVTHIQSSLPNARWHHINGRDNPADCASRGILPHELQEHPLWWHGPTWLTSTTSNWVSPSGLRIEDDLPEQRRSVHATQRDGGEPWDLLHRYSALQTLVRVTAWCRRWVTTIRRRITRGHPEKVDYPPFLTSQELREAQLFWIGHVQGIEYSSTIRALKDKRPLPTGSPLLRLAPFLDERGLLRVGGRLTHALLHEDEKHPLIVPRNSRLTTMLIVHWHRLTLHGGVQLTLSALRRFVWILQGRQVVRHCIHQCVTCARWRAATKTQLMGNLPTRRVVPSRPFLHTGLDYAGPIYIRTTKGRGHRAYKGYIVIFVCCSTRAVHIELVSDYSAEAFLAAYRRFVSRRGLCRSLSSDCGTNLIGAEAQLRHLFQAANQEFGRIANQLANDGVEWRFNPPSAPHFGGLWEATVKSVKFHLRRVIGETTLTFEELYTLLVQIEACLNSRPLQALSDDPDDITALTPGHFLVGAPLKSIPEPSLDDQPIPRLTRWQLMQRMRDDFWRRWSSEYLHTLQSRQKWWRSEDQVLVGDLCLIKNELYPPSRWPLARVTQTHPGDDGRTRVVSIRTSTSELRRPIAKIVLLPRSSNETTTLPKQ